MMLTNKNIQISFLDINRKSVISLLNRLPYLSHSRNLKVGMCM